MKKILAWFLALTLAFSATACGQTGTVSSAPVESTVTSSAPVESTDTSSAPAEFPLPDNILSETEDSITLNDKLAGEVTILKRPKRVVVLLNAVLELWYMAGGTAVARLSGEDNVPEAAKALPLAGSVGNPSVEQIVASEPDLVILVNTMEASRKVQPALTEAGIPNLSVEYRDYDDFLALMGLFTRLTGETGEVEKVEKIDTEVKAILAEQEGKTPLKSLILYSNGKYVKAATNGSVPGDMLTRLGAENVIGEAAAKGQTNVDFSREAVVQSDPDIIFIQVANDPEAGEAMTRQELADNAAWGAVKAVKNGCVYLLPREYSTLKPNARYPEAFRFLAEKLDEARGKS